MARLLRNTLCTTGLDREKVEVERHQLELVEVVVLRLSVEIEGAGGQPFPKVPPKTLNLVSYVRPKTYVHP